LNAHQIGDWHEDVGAHDLQSKPGKHGTVCALTTFEILFLHYWQSSTLQSGVKQDFE